jgi:sugar phosphate isomerase/epimerase
MIFRTSIVALLALIFGAQVAADEPSTTGIYAADNLVAWCIVPFDANKRGPAARAEMLVRLGLKHVAYDWRAEHVATFEEEILQYKKHGLNYFAFWSWHEAMEPLIKKYGIKPQIWSTAPSPNADSQQNRVKAAVEAVLPLVEKTRSLGCRFGLYNHGGWGGLPENLVAVCQYLREHHQADHVGIVYNFHHGHEHMADFGDKLPAMKPYLMCLNINGMDDAATVASGSNKILPVGSGKHELTMLKIVKSSGYTGPIGVLDHRSNLDTEKSLRQNLDGLRKLVSEGL